MVTPARLLAITLVTISAACGVTLSPRVEMGEGYGDAARGLPERPAPPAVSPGRDAVAREICRTGPMPRGWIAVRYTAGDERCPRVPDADDRYTAAVIYRYSDAPLGSTMAVCADQALPQGWARLGADASDAECPRARVREGAPTSYVMRRIR